MAGASVDINNFKLQWIGRSRQLAVILVYSATEIYEIKERKSVQGFHPNKHTKIVLYNCFNPL